jgi:thiol-disulfide isomerase/thioredoxin
VLADDPIRLDVYTAHGCCLCDEARELLDPLARELALDVRWIHIDGDEQLESTWREQLPAGVLDGRKVFKYRVDPELLRRRVRRLRGA